MTKKKLSLLFFSLCFLLTRAQTLKISGNTKDTSIKQGLPNVLLMALKFNDSTLVHHGRSNNDGIFKTFRLPLDTYLVILSHPSFSDKTYLLVPSPKDTAYNFKNVVLPPKSVVLNEVEIMAYREKTYYKGDTLIFTADSFKTRPNATVEDLLKKLPGVRVDAAGKITVQGKEVDQVLVDGDEFFGSDPTIATRNLNAASVDNVQVYDKKNDNAEDGKSETVKVVNLKMKDDAKKGYFGKLSGASDFQKFYENELLLNKFKGNRKASVFGLVANTPKQAFGWNEINKYGLDQETPYSYDEETNSWTSNRDEKSGLPQTIKTGFYFSDKYGKNTKLNIDYTFNQNKLQTGTETNTQFFLTDTSYNNSRVSKSLSFNQNHAFNGRITQKLDSLTELTLVPKVKYNNSENTNTQTDNFTSEENIVTRNTLISNTTKIKNTDINLQIKVARNFLKKDRSLTFNYQPIYDESYGNTTLNTNYNYFLNQSINTRTSQKKNFQNFKMEHNASIIFVEPFTKKLKTELSYNFMNNQTINNRKTVDSTATGFDLFNPVLSNNFNNTRISNKIGAKLIYDVKKFRVSVGTAFRNVHQDYLNVTTGKKLAPLEVNNVLPSASFNYRVNQGSQLTLSYAASSQQPDIKQLQPITDNADPNRISIGNPALKATFSNNFNLNYYFYKGISDRNFWSGATFNNTNNQITNSTSYDSQGRALSQPVNINGNFYGNFYLGGGFPIFKRFMKIYYNLNGSHSNNVSYVNNLKNISQNSGIGPGLTFEKANDKFEARVEGNYHYNVPKTNISERATQPYYTYDVNGSILIKFPKKIAFSADGNYTNNGNRTPGYNLNYFIVNTSLSKTFLKSENLIVSFEANDVLNQNISNQRNINTNQIIDTKTQIIKRYFLFKVLLKLNSQKVKSEDDED